MAICSFATATGRHRIEGPGMTPAFLKLINKQGVNIAPGGGNWQGYEGWIALMHYALGPSNAVPSGQGAGHVKASSIAISKSWDSASATLEQMYTTGINQPCNAILDVII